MKKIKFKYSKDNDFDLFLDRSTFEPTFTTNLIIESVLKNLSKNSTILDLGCGSGVVGIVINELSKFKHSFFASDIFETVKDVVSKNANLNNVKIKIEQSDTFSSWNRRFDCIIDDISGISSEVAKLSPWFENIACDSGIGGDILTNKVLRQAPSYLENDGLFFFPVISLSNSSSILNKARENFKNLELVSSKDWPLPSSMANNLSALNDLRDLGHISFEEKFGILVASTSIYKAYN